VFLPHAVRTHAPPHVPVSLRGLQLRALPWHAVAPLCFSAHAATTLSSPPLRLACSSRLLVPAATKNHAAALDLLGSAGLPECGVTAHELTAVLSAPVSGDQGNEWLRSAAEALDNATTMHVIHVEDVVKALPDF